MTSFTITIDGSASSRWMSFKTVDSITKVAGYFEILLENADNTLSYEQFDEVIVAIDATTVFIGRIEQIEPKTDGTYFIWGRNYLNALMEIGRASCRERV